MDYPVTHAVKETVKIDGGFKMHNVFSAVI
jgi:hypothetical protein